MDRDFLLLVDLLARITLELVTLLALDGGLVFVTPLTNDIIGIHRFLLDGCGHHPSSEVVGGEILSPPLWKLERTMAFGTLDFPARG